MAQQCCPTCGRAFAKPKAVQVPVDLAAMTPDQLFAHYKKTAPIEDVRFALRAGVDLGPFRDDWQALLGLAPTLARGEVYRRLSILQGEARRARNARDGAYAVGSKAWHTRRARAEARAVAERARTVRLEVKGKRIDAWRARHPHGWEKWRAA